LPGCPAVVPSTEAAPSYFLKLTVSTTGLFRGAREHRRTKDRRSPDHLAMQQQLRIVSAF
jgi:hypothetical protein